MMKKSFLLILLFPIICFASDFDGNKIYWRADRNSFVPYYNQSSAYNGPGRYTSPSPAITSNALPSGSAPYRSSAIVPSPGSWPSAYSRSPLPIPNGPIIDVNAKFKPSPTASALFRFASKIATPLAVGSALYDLAQELGYTPEGFGDTLSFKKEIFDCPGGCIKWSYNGQLPPFFSTREQACSARAQQEANYRGVPITMHSVDSGNICYANWQGFSNPMWLGPMTTVTLTPTLMTEYKTLQQFTDEIASQSGWPSSSSIADAIKETLESGENIEMETPTVTGPSSTPSTSTTTTNTTNNTTTTTNTTNNYTYDGNKVIYNQTTTTTILNNDTGESNTITETTDNSPELPPEEQKQLCELFPDILACKELQAPDPETIPTETRDITLQSGPTFSGSSCPPDVVVNVAGRSVTLLDTSQACGWIESFMRPIILLLAAISAAFIVLPRES